MKESLSDITSMKIAGDIVIAFLSNGSIDSSKLADLVRDVHAALIVPGSAELNSEEHGMIQVSAPQLGVVRTKEQPRDEPQAPATMTVEESISPDFLICFEDLKPYRSLKRHLMTRYGLTPEQYRLKWGLPPDYPMVAENYSRARSEVAKRIGLGGRTDQKQKAGSLIG